MEKIVFYEGQDFQGKSYDCKGDSADLYSYIHRCNSVKVHGGWWVLYERSNFSGYQYIVGPGEYNVYGQWMGFNDCVRSCKIIKNSKGPFKLKLYGQPNFNGQTLEVTENMKSLREKWLQKVMSCKVLEGSWVFYEHPNFSGRQYLLEKGEYGSPSEWGALTATVASIRRIMELPKSDS
ncbi:gamma-crystallin 2-like [Cyprinodon tularosa]|uniref:gamma-crystallin 2-like n=1 Tax=Cyprinodon variegatus TaxID=28743 RepID=UPI000742C451|nr:PREDICTED: gamma-crystallin 2-like [Cyprinodon variegatus]XP_038131874.1 gamma-crystallin 2-like [Cyprinodon tularosa]